MGGMNKPIGGGFTVGNAIGAAGAGVQGFRASRDERSAWQMTAEQFSQLGPEGQKIAQMILQNPDVAAIHAERMGGWSSYYNDTKANFSRSQMVRSLQAARSDQRLTAPERRDITTEAFEGGIHPTAVEGVIEAGTGDYMSIFRGLSPNYWDPKTILTGMQHAAETDDVVGGLDMVQPLKEEKGWAKGTPELLKWLEIRRKMREEGQEGTQDFKDIQNRIDKLSRYKSGSGEGEITEPQRRTNNEIEAARSYIRSYIAKRKKEGKPASKQDLFGTTDTIQAGFLNPEDPMVAKQINIALKPKYFEDLGEYERFRAWVEENAPTSTSPFSFDPAKGFEPKATPTPTSTPTPLPSPTVNDAELAAELERQLRGGGQ